MTKTIKFNLILDGEPVRTLDQLKDNFNIDDILQHYKSGVLQRWLETRGIEEELKKINKIKGSNLIETAKNLSEIFNKNISIEEIGHAVYHLQIKQDEEDRLKRTNRIKNIKFLLITQIRQTNLKKIISAKKLVRQLQLFFCRFFQKLS